MPLECWNMPLWHVDGEKIFFWSWHSWTHIPYINVYWHSTNVCFFHALFFNLLIFPPLGLLYIWCGLCFTSKTPLYVRLSQVSMPLPDRLTSAQSARPWSVVSLCPVLSALEWTPLLCIRAFIQLTFIYHNLLTRNFVIPLPYILKRCFSIVLSYKTNKSQGKCGRVFLHVESHLVCYIHYNSEFLSHAPKVVIWGDSQFAYVLSKFPKVVKYVLGNKCP